MWRTLLLTGWEQSSPVDEEEIQIKMDDSAARFPDSLQREFLYLLTCGRRSLVSGTQNEIVVSWITLWGMIKVYWLDFSLYFQSCCLLRVCCKFGPKLASPYKPVENEVKFVKLSEPCSQTNTSIKKRIIVHWTVWSTFPQLRTGFSRKRVRQKEWGSRLKSEKEGRNRESGSQTERARGLGWRVREKAGTGNQDPRQGADITQPQPLSGEKEIPRKASQTNSKLWGGNDCQWILSDLHLV